MNFSQILSSRFFRYGVAILGVMLVTLLLEPFHEKLSSTTVALAFLLVVLFSATFFGRNPALLSSFLAMLCFNYFFLPPVRTWTISEPQNLVAWGAFTLTAIIAGELSAYARRRAGEAEKLYDELQKAFEVASKNEAIKRSEKLKSALLDAVTHDLRTPLTSIKASVTMLLEENSADAIHVTLEREGRTELLEVINEETDRLNDFVESMVEVAKLEAGEFNFQKTDAWQKWDLGIKLEVLSSPYRSLTQPLLEYIDQIDHQADDDLLTVILPEFVPAKWWHQILHNQSSLVLKGYLLFKKGVIVTNVPYHLKH